MKTENFSVLRINGKQYLVTDGDKLKIDRISPNTLVEVLLSNNGNELIIGDPIVEGYGVVGTILEEKKDAKINVRKFKAKSRYRRNKGHRQSITILQVDTVKKGKSELKFKVKETVAKEPADEKVAVKVNKNQDSISIETLDITDKMKANLKDAGYHTVSDVKKASREDLMSVKGFGEKAVDKLLQEIK